MGKWIKGGVAWKNFVREDTRFRFTIKFWDENVFYRLSDFGKIFSSYSRQSYVDLCKVSLGFLLWCSFSKALCLDMISWVSSRRRRITVSKISKVYDCNAGIVYLESRLSLDKRIQAVRAYYRTKNAFETVLQLKFWNCLTHSNLVFSQFLRRF